MCKKWIEKSTALLLCLIFACTVLSMNVFAHRAIEPQHDASLTVQYEINGEAIPDVSVHIYPVAEINGTIYFNPLSPFSECPVADLNHLDAEGWRNAAHTYAAYAAAENIPAMKQGHTDENGLVVFDDIPIGLYLIIYSAVQIGEENEFTYYSEPVLVSVPSLDEETDTWIYDVRVKAKPGIPDTYRRIMKIWKGDNESIRPESITVQLYCRPVGQDNEAFTKFGPPIVLNKENNWQYYCEELSAAYEWKLQETEVSSGYVVSIVPQGTTITITNEYPAPPPPPKVPQTGTTWYIVPYLVLAGLLFLIIGLAVRSKEERSDEKK